MRRPKPLPKPKLIMGGGNCCIRTGGPRLGLGYPKPKIKR